MMKIFTARKILAPRQSSNLRKGYVGVRTVVVVLGFVWLGLFDEIKAVSESLKPLVELISQELAEANSPSLKEEQSNGHQ